MDGDGSPGSSGSARVPSASLDSVAGLDPAARLDRAAAAAVAETLQGLAATSRVLILARLRQAPCPVSTLAADVGMTQSAVSHQLRLLRDLGLVARTRHGKMTIYQLYDEHVAMLLDEAVYHSGHLRQGR